MRFLKKRMGEIIRTQRLLKGIRTQSALAEKLGVEPATVSRWESGSFVPSDDHLEALCKELGVTDDIFFNDQTWYQHDAAANKIIDPIVNRKTVGPLVKYANSYEDKIETLINRVDELEKAQKQESGLPEDLLTLLRRAKPYVLQDIKRLLVESEKLDYETKAPHHKKKV